MKNHKLSAQGVQIADEMQNTRWAEDNKSELIFKVLGTRLVKDENYRDHPDTVSVVYANRPSILKT